MKINSDCKKSPLCTLKTLNDQYIKYTIILNPESTYKINTTFTATKY